MDGVGPAAPLVLDGHSQAGCFFANAHDTADFAGCGGAFSDLVEHTLIKTVVTHSSIISVGGVVNMALAAQLPLTARAAVRPRAPHRCAALQQTAQTSEVSNRIVVKRGLSQQELEVRDMEPLLWMLTANANA